MIKISILYPADEGARFDVNYYLNVHAPMALGCLDSAILSFQIDVGILVSPMPAPSYVAAGHYICESSADFLNAYLPHAKELQADVANFTDIMPIIQLSQVHYVKPAQA